MSKESLDMKKKSLTTNGASGILGQISDLLEFLSERLTFAMLFFFFFSSYFLVHFENICAQFPKADSMKESWIWLFKWFKIYV